MSLEETLRAIVREELAEAVRLLREQPPALLDSKQLGQAIGVSRSFVSRMLREGCPRVYAGDSPRFSLVEVIQWMKQQSR